jgi:hypothetical protein
LLFAQHAVQVAAQLLLRLPPPSLPLLEVLHLVLTLVAPALPAPVLALPREALLPARVLQALLRPAAARAHLALAHLDRVLVPLQVALLLAQGLQALPCPVWDRAWARVLDLLRLQVPPLVAHTATAAASRPQSPQLLVPACEAGHLPVQHHFLVLLQDSLSWVVSYQRLLGFVVFWLLPCDGI